MSPVLVASRPWPRRRWWGLVVLVFMVQLGLIFWLGETAPTRPRVPAAGLILRLAGSGRGSAELLALRDPTLFVLPHPQVVSRPSGPSAPRPEADALTWLEPTNYPPPALDQPGAAFAHFLKSNVFETLRPPATPPPRLTLPALPPSPIHQDRSVVQLEGSLAQRRLITPLDLPAQTNGDILRDSVVRLIVGTDGVPRSATLLATSGSTEADQFALDQARGARFESLDRNPANPAPDPLAALTRGRLIFRWRTVPLPPTNSPPATP